MSKVQNIVPQQRGTIPILSNILLEADNDELVVTGTDLTVGVRCFTGAKVMQAGSITLPVRHVSQLVREVPAANIEFSTNKNEAVEIVADASRFRIHGMGRDEFPVLPDLQGATSFSLPQGALKDALFRTAFAVAKEDTRYTLTGLFLGIQQGIAQFVGTDGKRLAKVELRVSLPQDFTGEYIIPLKAVEEIIKNLGDDQQIATLYLMEDKIALETDQTLLVTKLLSGDYPDFDRVIPKDPELSIELHREEMASLLRQVSLFTNETSYSARFSLTPGQLQLTANSANVGEGKVSMPVNYGGQPLDIAFSPSSFLDILKHCRSETVWLKLTDAYNPGMINEPNTLGSLFILMPMRLSTEG